MLSFSLQLNKVRGIKFSPALSICVPLVPILLVKPYSKSVLHNHNHAVLHNLVTRVLVRSNVGTSLKVVKWNVDLCSVKCVIFLRPKTFHLPIASLGYFTKQ